MERTHQSSSPVTAGHPREDAIGWSAAKAMFGAIETFLGVLVVLQLIGLTIAAYLILRRK